MNRKRKSRLVAVVKWAAIVVASLILFILAKDYALRERGYSAAGGEYMLLLLPLILYAAGQTVKDWIADLRALFREVRQ